MPTITDSIRAPQPLPPQNLAGPVPLQFRHRTIDGISNEVDNIMFPGYWTRLEHPALDNSPNAIPTVTAVGRVEVNEQAHTATLISNPNPVGVLYREGDARWYIYNLGLEAMDINVDFHVAINEETQAA
jgi:hypothetical protein